VDGAAASEQASKSTTSTRSRSADQRRSRTFGYSAALTNGLLAERDFGREHIERLKNARGGTAAR
jgi:hypothetical protein